jgi:beta-lactamase superfamily II metal-dependent hydrolase
MAAETKYLDDDIVKLHEFGKPKSAATLKATLFWGDRVRVVGQEGGKTKVELPRREWVTAEHRYRTTTFQCELPKGTRFREGPLLKVRFVDVGQGDAAMVETPRGETLLIDGGEGEHLRRYVNVAFSHVLRYAPLRCDAVVVTHGDADHFAGLTELLSWHRSRTSPLVSVDRVFHNGLVKRTAKDVEAFGRTVVRDGQTYVVDLVDDLTDVPDERLNTPFRRWRDRLRDRKRQGGGPAVRRLEYGDDDAFDFLDPNLQVKVLGPITDEIDGRPALRFLRVPGRRSLSDSHTINGHSIVLRLSYGNVRFLFGADLNEESEQRLLERAREDDQSLASEILKVPHHGSADFSPRMLEAVRAVVSVVSSGDENELVEYIHPRAGLVGALGRYSRQTVERPLVYVTEMVAFFRRLGAIHALKLDEDGGDGEDLGNLMNAYQKTSFGIVHVRTDGERVLVVTHSGKDNQKEGYAFRVDANGSIDMEPKVRIR